MLCAPAGSPARGVQPDNLSIYFCCQDVKGRLRFTRFQRSVIVPRSSQTRRRCCSPAALPCAHRAFSVFAGILPDSLPQNLCGILAWLLALLVFRSILAWLLALPTDVALWGELFLRWNRRSADSSARGALYAYNQVKEVCPAAANNPPRDARGARRLRRARKN